MTAHSALFVTTIALTLEAFLTPFADSLRSAGWRVDALANGATTTPGIREHFDALHDIGWSRSPFDRRNLVGTSTRVRTLAEEGGYDIVHVHTPIAAFVTRFALRNRATPDRPTVIYTAHGFHFYEGQSRLLSTLYRRTERAAARWTDYLVTINAEDFSAARAFGTIDADRVRLIPGIGVDTTRYTPVDTRSDVAKSIRDELGIHADAFVVTMIGEFSPVKRHEHLLEALAGVEDPSVVVVLVGEGALESRLREKAVALRVGDRVRWAGYRRDIPAVLAASDALVACSEREGLNRSVLEAMASGLPVIGTRTRGIADAITPETGWLVPKDDVGELAAAITEAASDRAGGRRRGAAGRTRAEREFAVPHIIEAYEELYREALASRV